MNQKETVYNFLKTLKATMDNSEIWNTFTNEYPTIKKGNFNFYKNQATKEGVYVVTKNKSTLINTSISAKMTGYKELHIQTIDLTNIDPKKFKAIATGTPIDLIASKRNGFMPGTAYLITGESGAGKTTVSTNIADYLKENNVDINYTAGFISCEMDKDDWTEECLDNPKLATLDTVFMLEYLDAPNYLEVLTQALMTWNFVILDSFEVVIDQLRDIKGWTAKKAESELITILRKASTEANCTILAIQQYTKSGNFVGSNKIKHLLTGMIFVKFDKYGDRYIVFTKNRRGGHMVGKHLYFTKNKETGRIEFNGKRLENDMAIQEFNDEEFDNIEIENDIFDNEVLENAKNRRDILENIRNRRDILENV